MGLKEQVELNSMDLWRFQTQNEQKVELTTASTVFLELRHSLRQDIAALFTVASAGDEKLHHIAGAT